MNEPFANSAAHPNSPLTEPEIYRHHPVIGVEYVPCVHLTRPRPDGGFYELNVNAAGIRSNREYSLAKPIDVYRILVFGDSQADGFYQSNECRFSELIEYRNPGLEIINFSLPGFGTDQQLLMFEEIGSKYEHDLVILLPFLSNIRRNLAATVTWRDPKTGHLIVQAKPQFVLAPREDGTDGLELRNFPVPEKRRIADEPADPTAAASQSSGLGRLLWHARKKLSAARKLCAFGIRKRVIYPLLSRLGWDPFPLLGQLGYDIYPEYQAADTEEWRLMAAILRRFAQGKGQKPFVVAPLVDSLYTRFAVGRSYWERFSSLADGERVHVIDLLPHFLKLGRQAPRCFLEPHDSHLSDFGHSVLADAVESELRRLDILPIGNFESHGAGADKQTTIQNRG